VDRITPELVDDLALGAGLLAAGGGAQPWPAGEPLRRALGEHGPVRLIDAAQLVDVAELDRNAFVLAVGAVGPSGAGTAAAFPDAAGLRRLVTAAERHGSRRCAAVVPLEIGGMSALAAPFAAAVLGLPCVDADGAGRGFSRLDLTLFALGGVAASPAFVADGEGNLVTVESADDRAAHRLVRAAASDLGGAAIVGGYPMTARECARTAAAGSVRYCVGLGRMARTLRASGGGAAAQRLASYGVRLLFTGQVVHVARRDSAGSPRGTATVETVSGPARTMRIDFQQGMLVLSEDGVVCATVPDLISVVDEDAWAPAHTDRLAPGQRVHVLAIQAHERWRLPDGIAAAGPRQFGYDIDYQPLELLRVALRCVGGSYDP